MATPNPQYISKSRDNRPRSLLRGIPEGIRVLQSDDNVGVISSASSRCERDSAPGWHSSPRQAAGYSARDNKNHWTILRKKQYEFLERYLPSLGKAIDVGAGPQQFLELTKRFDLTAVDIQPFEGITQVVDLEKGLPFPDNSFDVVISTNTFEHIHNVNNLVRECVRLLKRGGVLIGSVPFFLPLHQEPYDFRRFTIYELEKMFKEVGFHDLKIEPLGTARDSYYQASYHFFVKLYDAKRYYLVVKILWNMQKLIFWAFDWLYRTNASQRSPLGYGFYAKK